jgi:hypothetical protein
MLNAKTLSLAPDIPFLILRRLFLLLLLSSYFHCPGFPPGQSAQAWSIMTGWVRLILLHCTSQRWVLSGFDSWGRAIFDFNRLLATNLFSSVVQSF